MKENTRKNRNVVLLLVKHETKMTGKRIRLRITIHTKIAQNQITNRYSAVLRKYDKNIL